MGTFNAGAIEAKLTLDRSAFTRELNSARAEARVFENDDIEPRLQLKGQDTIDRIKAELNRLDGMAIDIRVDISGDASGELARIRAELDRLSRRKIGIDIDIDGFDELVAMEELIDSMDTKKIDVDIDVDNALDSMVELESLIEAFDGRNIELQVDIDGMAKLAALGVAAEALDGKNIDFDVQTGPGSGIAAGVSGFSRMQALVGAVTLLLPLASPMIASAGAATIGLASGLTAAAGALGAVGLAVGPTLSDFMSLREELEKQRTKLAALTPGTEAYAKQLEKIGNLQRVMNNDYGEASKGITELGAAWDKFQTQVRPEANQIIGAMFRTLASLIPAITPIFKAAAPVVLGLFNGITAFAKGPEMQRVITFFSEFGSNALGSLLSIGGNLLKFLGRLFEAFAPFGGDLLEDIDRMTAAWANWADGLGQTQGFQDFMAYVAVEGPKVWDFFVQLGAALINIGVALAPIGSVLLTAFDGIFTFIAQMDPTILGAIAAAVSVVVIGLIALSAVMSLISFIMAANPIGLIVIAIAALVGAILYLWNNNETFKNAILAIYEAIKSGIGAVVGFFTDTVVPAFQTAWSTITGFFSAAWEQIGPIVTLIIDIVSLVAQIIFQQFSMVYGIVSPIIAAFVGVAILMFRNMWTFISTVVKQIWLVVSTTFQHMATVVGAVMNVIWTVISSTWSVIRGIWITVLGFIKGILGAALSFMKGDVEGGMNKIKATFTNTWNNIKNVVNTAINGVKNVINSGINAARTIMNSVLNSILSIVRGTMNNVLGAFRSVINNIKGAFSGASGMLTGAGRSIVQGLINGIKGMAGAVKSAIGGVLQSARNLLPFSPAKEGPFSGKGWTLYSGRSIVESLAQGVKDRKAMLRDALTNTITDVMPDMGMDLGGTGNTALNLAPVGGGGTVVNVDMKNYNPVAEPSSVTAIRGMSRLGQLGAFNG